MSKLLNQIKVVLIDLSGTIHIDDSVIPGSIEALLRLRNCNKLKLKFVTNTTKESKESLINRLTQIGLDIKENEIFTSLAAARLLIVSRNLRPYFMLSEDAMKDFKGIPVNDPNAVVVGLAPDAFNFENMTYALRLLLNGASLIAIHKGRYYRRTDGLAIGPGAFVAALEYSSGVKAEVVGKPERSFFLSALEEFNVPPSQAIMIGDDARDDVGGAMEAGLCGCLVKTGKYRNEDEVQLKTSPLLVSNCFAEAVDSIIQNQLD